MRRFMTVLLVMAVYAVSHLSAAAAPDSDPFWVRWEHPFRNQEVLSVDFVNARDGWAAGGNGVILVTHDGGTNWNSQHSGTGTNLQSVQFVDARDGWVVGTNGTILATRDGGENWRPQSSGTDIELTGARFVDAQTGWVVGYGGTILATHDGGGNWAPQQSGSDTILRAVEFANRQTGWVVGAGGTILVTHNGGASWQAQQSGTGSDLAAASFIDAQHGWVAGAEETVLVTKDGGQSWQAQLGANGLALEAVKFVNAQIGWAAGANGTVLATQDGGSTWHAQTNIPGHNLEGLSFTDGKTGWAVGHGGAILATTDGGASWQRQHMGSTEYLWGVSLPDPQNGWAAGAAGMIIATGDGGEQWRRQNSGTKRDLKGIAFPDATAGWAVGDGGTILATRDAGASWQAQSSGTNETLMAVNFADRQHGWAVGDGGTILGTRDGGAHWQSQASGSENNLWGVHFVDAQTGWAVGWQGTILVTHDAGITWRHQASGVTYDLAAVDFTDARHGWVAGSFGVILGTSDGGATWIQEQSNTDLLLLGVHFANPQTGWIVGYGGAILATQDGGLIWARQYSGTGNELRAIDFGGGTNLWAVGITGTMVRAAERFEPPTIEDPAAITTAGGEVTLTFRVVAGEHVSPARGVIIAGRTGVNPSWAKLGDAVAVPGVDGRWKFIWKPGSVSIGAGSKISYGFAVDDGGPLAIERTADFVFNPTEPLPQQVRDWALGLSGKQIAEYVAAVVLLWWALLVGWLYWRNPARLVDWHEALPEPASIDGVATMLAKVTFGAAGLLLWVARGSILFLGTSPRALDAWVLARREDARAYFIARPSVRDRHIAVDLPVAIGGTHCDEPLPEIGKLLGRDAPLAMLISGPGGAGKTTLACRIARRAMGSLDQPPLGGHAMLPLFIQADAPDDAAKANGLCPYLAGLLRPAVNETRPISVTLTSALLRKGRVLVIVDGLSERSAATQQAFGPEKQGFEINRLIVTSRTPELPGMSDIVETESIATGMLFDFIERYLQEMVKSNEGQAPSEDKVLDACADLKRLLGDTPCTPLLAAMWAREIGGAPDDSARPRGVASLMESYLRRILLPAAQGSEGLVDRLTRDAAKIAERELGDRYTPGFVTRAAALDVMRALDPADVEKRMELLQTSRLLESPSQHSDAVRISPDPVAEHLVAHLRCDDLGADADKWQGFLSGLAKQGAPAGFAAALAACAEDPVYGALIPDAIKRRITILLANQGVQAAA